MAKDDKDNNENKPPEVTAAEPVVWDTYRRDLESQGNEEEVLYLEHFLKLDPKDVENKGAFKHVPFDVYQRLSDYTAGYNAQSGERTSWVFNALMEKSGRRMDPQTGIALATQAALPPSDAIREVAEYQTAGGDPYFMVRWKHEVNEIPIERDYIQVLVNGNTEKVFSVNRKWHDLDEKPTVR